MAQIEELYHLNKEKEVPQAPLKEKETYDFDFTPNGVDLNSFPYEVWRKLFIGKLYGTSAHSQMLRQCSCRRKFFSVREMSSLNIQLDILVNLLIKRRFGIVF